MSVLESIKKTLNRCIYSDEPDDTFKKATPSDNYFEAADNEFEAETQKNIPGECYVGNTAAPEDNAKTLKTRHIVYGLGGLAFFCICLLISNSLSAPKAPHKSENNDLSLSSKVNNPAAGLPDSYKDIAKYNDQLAKKNLPRGTEKETVEQISVLPQPNPVRNNSVQPAPYNPPPPQPSVPANSISNKEEMERREKEKALSSPISFNIKATNYGDNPRSDTSSANDAIYSNMPAPLAAGSVYEESSYKLSAGTIIPATMLTGATSDAPGSDVVAVVRQDVFDSMKGRKLLIPQGTKLIGKSGAAGLRGNKRLTMVFSRIIFPNGISMLLPDFQSIDGTGLPGLKDKYDQHSSTLLRTAFLAAVFAAGAQSATGHSNGTDSRTPGEEAVAGSVASILNMAQSIVNRDANLNPTLTINPGLQFSVFISRDLVLGAYRDE